MVQIGKLKGGGDVRIGSFAPLAQFQVCPLYSESDRLVDLQNQARWAISDQSAPLQTMAYSITWSARASSAGGTVRPSALAVLRLIASSYLVGACTGKLAGASPLRIRST